MEFRKVYNNLILYFTCTMVNNVYYSKCCYVIIYDIINATHNY